MGGAVHVIGHPLVQHKLSLLRRKQTSTSEFRSLVAEISMLLAYEVTRDLPTQPVEVETPLTRTTAPVLDGKKIVLIPILRAGTGILDGMLRVLPSARVGHIGLYRDPGTLAAVEYYFKIPKVMRDRDAIVVDPMLATGNSAVAAVDRLKATGPRSIKFVCLAHLPRGPAPLPRPACRRAGLHGVRGQPPRRARLHRAGAGRRGRPPLRHQVAPFTPNTLPGGGEGRVRGTRWGRRADPAAASGAGSRCSPPAHRRSRRRGARAPRAGPAPARARRPR